MNRKNKILLVEDEPNIARLFNYTLTKAGYTVCFAENGSVGLNKVYEDRPDLIISDIMMPEVDGFEFRKMLLEDKNVADIPFVFLTAKGSEDDILEGYNLSIEEYIIKTESPKIVVAKINSIFESLKRGRENAVFEVQKAADNFKIKVVPEGFPKLDGFEIKHYHKPFESVPGGDFIDYIKLNDETLVVVTGDVMGKKWGAWYFAVAYAGYVRNAVRVACSSVAEYSPKLIMQSINEMIYNDERISEVFITLSIVIVNSNLNIIKYCGAGDLPLLLAGDKVDIVKSNGLLLGFSLESNYEDISIEIESNQVLYLITDGVVELRNNAGVQLGYENLSGIIFKSIKKESSLTEIIKELSLYSNNNFEDDLSIIQIKKL